MGGLLHLVQQRGVGAGPQPAQAHLCCTKCKVFSWANNIRMQNFSRIRPPVFSSVVDRQTDKHPKNITSLAEVTRSQNITA